MYYSLIEKDSDGCALRLSGGLSPKQVQLTSSLLQSTKNGRALNPNTSYRIVQVIQETT